MTDAIVIGGGVAGLSAATALANEGFRVELFEAKPFWGGRATSYALPLANSHEAEIDNCQHILLKCCVNLLNFYGRLGVADRIEFHREFYFMEPGGRTSFLRRGLLPAPLHFTESFLRATYLNLGEKIALGRAMLALRFERKRRKDLDAITMLDWLREKNQPARLIERFWRQVLVSAINVELDQMAASHGFQVMWLGFMVASDTYEMGIPKVPLAQLYQSAFKTVVGHERAIVEAFDPERGILVDGTWHQARTYISAIPSDRLAKLVPQLDIDYAAFEPSSITGVYIWFDRPVTSMPHGTLLDRHIQWFYNKGEGRYLMLVISASDSMLKMQRQEVIDLALRELTEFLPAVAEAQVVRAHVVKEAKATFRAKPGLEAKRPISTTAIPNFFLAGDWTRSGWPATMEGAVRSGYLAAEAASAALGKPARFLLPDLA